jgi:hypothetical protein
MGGNMRRTRSQPHLASLMRIAPVMSIYIGITETIQEAAPIHSLQSLLRGIKTGLAISIPVVKNPWGRIQQLDMIPLLRARRGGERALGRLKKLMSLMFGMTWLRGNYQVEVQELYHERMYMWEIFGCEIYWGQPGAFGDFGIEFWRLCLLLLV